MRLSPLLQAVVAISENLDLHTTLSRIVAAACQVADARYGALGVIGPDRTLVEVITDGLTVTEHHDTGRCHPFVRRDAGHLHSAAASACDHEIRPLQTLGGVLFAAYLR